MKQLREQEHLRQLFGLALDDAMTGRADAQEIRESVCRPIIDEQPKRLQVMYVELLAVGGFGNSTSSTAIPVPLSRPLSLAMPVRSVIIRYATLPEMAFTTALSLGLASDRAVNAIRGIELHSLTSNVHSAFGAWLRNQDPSRDSTASFRAECGKPRRIGSEIPTACLTLGRRAPACDSFALHPAEALSIATTKENGELFSALFAGQCLPRARRVTARHAAIDRALNARSRKEFIADLAGDVFPARHSRNVCIKTRRCNSSLGISRREIRKRLARGYTPSLDFGDCA